MANENDKVKSGMKGIVVADKMDKTVIVAVTEFKTHSKYRKKYKSTKRYKVADPENSHKVGDTVEITATKPISKDKKFKIV